MKILIAVLIMTLTSLFALSAFDVDKDKKVYYDADRDEQDAMAEQSKILDYFINSTVTQNIIMQYKSGKVRVTLKEIEDEINPPKKSGAIEQYKELEAKEAENE